MKLIAGLGNPGEQYRNTRHNLGFVVIDTLAELLKVKLPQPRDKVQALRFHHQGSAVMLVKPQTFMNLSGQAVAPLARRAGCEAEDILVISDDRHLPLGALRLRAGGGAGGHNGLKSLVSHLGTQDFHRLRLGIGGELVPPDQLSNYVLGKFMPSEVPQVCTLVRQAAEAARCWLEEGMDTAMSRYNRRNNTQGE
ncbi:MAG: aminoacyl-tRNA hydrolase [Candidatus Hydrogenedens sp.]|jgi:PTH1 family peptidyl-tRNA hydrolase|nr:aminoacyl-tRNA hydrolase [Candidatus Hydrogenedens sp.]